MNSKIGFFLLIASLVGFLCLQNFILKKENDRLVSLYKQKDLELLFLNQKIQDLELKKEEYLKIRQKEIPKILNSYQRIFIKDTTCANILGGANEILNVFFNATPP